jgi:Pilus formation protein N terminal region
MRAIRYALLTASVFTLTATVAFAASHPVRHPVKHNTPNDGITVPMDEAKVITFTQTVNTLFVGNPTIADVNIIDAHHAYLLGKTFGATNIIGLDADHHQVLNAQINVTNRRMGAVTLNRGVETYNYACTSLHCETNPRPGDPQTYMQNTENASASHEDYAAKMANGGGGGSNPQ